MQSTARFSLINCYNFATNCRFFQCRFVAVKNVVNETLQGLIDDTKRFVLCVNWRSSFWKSHCLKSQLVGFYENVRTLHKMLFVIFFPLPWIFPQGIFYRVFLNYIKDCSTSILENTFKSWFMIGPGLFTKGFWATVQFFVAVASAEAIIVGFSCTLWFMSEMMLKRRNFPAYIISPHIFHLGFIISFAISFLW